MDPTPGPSARGQAAAQVSADAIEVRRSPDVRPDPSAGADDHFRILEEHTTDAVTLYAPDNTILWASPAWQTMLGYDPQALVGRQVSVVHPDDREAAYERMSEAIAEHRAAFTNRVRVVAAQGAVHWVSAGINLVWRDDGELQHTIVAMRDVSDVVAAEERMTASEERYRLLAEHSIDVVLRLSLEGKVLWVSPSIVEMFGWERDELIGRTPLEFTHADDMESLVAKILRVRRTGEGWRATLRLRCTDGSYRWVDVVSAQMDAEDGSAGRVVRVRDIQAEIEARERAQAHARALERQAEELRRTNANLERFVDAASHDLQAPVRTIALRLDLITDTGTENLTEEQLQHLAEMRRSAAQAHAQILAVLKMSRLQHATPNPAVVDLQRECEAVAARLTGTGGDAAESPGVVTVMARLPRLHIDAAMVREVIEQLVDNALTYHRRGVPAQVELGPHAASAPGLAAFAVTDNGLGIQPGDRKRVFDLFQRLHSHEYPGIGLGLTVVASILELHEGRISVMDNPAGPGARFVVELPAG